MRAVDFIEPPHHRNLFLEQEAVAAPTVCVRQTSQPDVGGLLDRQDVLRGRGEHRHYSVGHSLIIEPPCQERGTYKRGRLHRAAQLGAYSVDVEMGNPVIYPTT